jgi:hypothetical protein
MASGDITNREWEIVRSGRDLSKYYQEFIWKG